MEDVVQRSISVSVQCPWCMQPLVDGRYPREMTLIFAPFVPVPDCCLYCAFEKFRVNIQRLLCDAL